MKPLLLTAALLFGACAMTQAQPADTAEPAELAVGDMAPDFTIKTFDDKTVTLSERFGDEGKPVVLLFSRANW